MMVYMLTFGRRRNGTAENSIDAYFRVAEAGLECIATDIRMSSDYFLAMIHGTGLGRTTDVGEMKAEAAYNPFTGEGYDPKVKDVNFTGNIEYLHLRGEQGRVRSEHVPILPDMIQRIRENGLNVVLQLNFKHKDDVEQAYWALKTLTNSAGVPANDCNTYMLQAEWYKTPSEFDALPWVQDAFHSAVKLAFIPVYNPADHNNLDTIASIKAFAQINYTISAEIEKQSTGEKLEAIRRWVKGNISEGHFKTSGTLYVPFFPW
jgi:glycerophosphoryl diester phosphodiesterase